MKTTTVLLQCVLNKCPMKYKPEKIKMNKINYPPHYKMVFKMTVVEFLQSKSCFEIGY
jgi:hypothetical protein